MLNDEFISSRVLLQLHQNGNQKYILSFKTAKLIFYPMFYCFQQNPQTSAKIHFCRDNRLQMVNLYSQGFVLEAISSIFRCSVSTIVYNAKTFVASKSIEDKPRSRRPRKTSDADNKHILLSVKRINIPPAIAS